ncbi:lysozyme inhibitor LprI family protein [Methylobacterium sp. P1-11]|uniref:lysozyme inhibitor LprI family protein n=1 Tax=Methylobacterium sp. P1-11 TaxID=2024616 RepID=UPI001567232B|nr:lysozyme inhibitor LprI family protein [Methylobacterium sp. P1-11]
MKRFSWAANPSAIIAMLALASPAYAIDCRKAATAIDRMICADRRLQMADAAMGLAYTSLLKTTDNAEIRAALVASQKRWLATRDRRLGHLNEDQDPPDPAAWRTIVLKAMQDRTRDLTPSTEGAAKLPRLIATVAAQRRFAARFSGGPFAGFATTCDFLPGSGTYSYGCFAMQSYQNDDRVCRRTEDWASGSVSETRFVGRVVDGALRTVATCSIGGGDGPSCPDRSSGSRGAWKRPAAASDAEKPPAPPLPKLDADVWMDDDAPWLPVCLTDPAYPPPGTARAP